MLKADDLLSKNGGLNEKSRTLTGTAFFNDDEEELLSGRSSSVSRNFFFFGFFGFLVFLVFFGRFGGFFFFLHVSSGSRSSSRSRNRLSGANDTGERKSYESGND